MALDLDGIQNAVNHLNAQPEDLRLRSLTAAEIAVEALKEHLPALCDMDLAAVAYYVAGLLTGLREMSLREVSATVDTTAVGYSIGTALLLGMLEA